MPHRLTDIIAFKPLLDLFGTQKRVLEGMRVACGFAVLSKGVSNPKTSCLMQARDACACLERLK